MNLTWIIVAVILIGSAIYGYWRGFVKMVLASLVVLAALLLTGACYPYVSNVLKNHTPAYDIAQEQIQTYLETELQGTMTEMLEDGAGAVGMETLDALNTNQQSQLISRIPLPESIRGALMENNNSEIYQLMGVSSFSGYLSNYLTVTILNAFAYVLTFLVLYAFLRIAVYALDLMAKLPVLHAANKWGGVLVALVFGVMLVWIFFLVATAASGTVFGRSVLKSVEESPLLSILYNHNLLMQLVTDMGKLLFSK